MDLVVELVAGAADALTERVAALNHEVGDDPVKNRAVVVLFSALFAGLRMRPFAAALGQLDEVADGLGSLVGKELDLDISAIGLQVRNQLLSHETAAFLYVRH